MRRFARHLATFCSAVSLLLCIAVCALGVRSYWTAYMYVSPTPKDAYTVVSDRGETCWRWLANSGRGRRAGGRFGSLDRRPADYGIRWSPPESGYRWPGGFWFENATFPTPIPGRASRRGTRYAVIVLPHWSLALAFAAGPTFVASRVVRRHRRRARGLCRACGYDLRASPDRCPECGALAVEVKA